MSTFTNIQRGSLRWQAPPQTPKVTTASPQYLLIADGFYLNIGDGNKLQIQAEVTPQVWSTVNRGVYRPTAPPQATAVTKLNIGSDFNLKISDDHYLVIGTASGGSNWTNVTRRNPLR